MKILINCLIFGNRPYEIINHNLLNAGLPCDIRIINKEGIANALNEGIKDWVKYDAIGFLSNDIIEPEGWLLKKAEALETYQGAGIVASSLDYARTEANNEHIISNWLISTKLIEVIGKFNENLFIDFVDIDGKTALH